MKESEIENVGVFVSSYLTDPGYYWCSQNKEGGFCSWQGSYKSESGAKKAALKYAKNGEKIKIGTLHLEVSVYDA